MRSCNLELQLLPPCCDDLFSTDHISRPHEHYSMLDVFGGRPKEEQQQLQQKQQQQKLTIFYNGKMSVCDVNELQAKAIIMVAKRESEKRPNSPSTSIPYSIPLQQQSQQLNSPSMKKSFQRFLLNRKNRIRSGSPY